MSIGNLTDGTTSASGWASTLLFCCLLAARRWPNARPPAFRVYCSLLLINTLLITRLIRDLEESGMLVRTLVIIASEFSRDMIMEGVPGSSANDQSTAKTDVI